MSYPVIIRPAAKADLNEAKRWYDQQQMGLGDELLKCVDEALAKVADNPALYPLVHRDVRRAVVSRFPYGIFYRAMNGRVFVTGIFHGRRDPRRSRSRR